MNLKTIANPRLPTDSLSIRIAKRRRPPSKIFARKRNFVDSGLPDGISRTRHGRRAASDRLAVFARGLAKEQRRRVRNPIEAGQPSNGRQSNAATADKCFATSTKSRRPLAGSGGFAAFNRAASRLSAAIIRLPRRAREAAPCLQGRATGLLRSCDRTGRRRRRRPGRQKRC